MLNEKLFYTPEEFRRILPCSRTVMYEALRQGKIRSFRLGRKIYIPATELDRLNRHTGDIKEETSKTHLDYW